MSRSGETRVWRGGAGDSDSLSNASPIGTWFRHESSRLVILLARKFGYQHLESIEDAVQTACTKGLVLWRGSTMPDSLSAWLYRVAYNELISILRARSGRSQLFDRHQETLYPAPSTDEVHAGGVEKEFVKILFLCCDPDLPRQSQLVFALKSLCGFSVKEIASRLFISEENTYKRISRSRQRLKAKQGGDSFFAGLNDSKLSLRLPAVLQVLYLLFSEGYLSSHSDHAIRTELCQEAIRLLEILVNQPVGAVPESYALLALMYLHAARLEARAHPSGGLLLLEEQDRSLWKTEEMSKGFMWLKQSASGDSFSRYHAEAGIAAEHCRAKSFSETNWERVVACYDLLEQVIPSALHRLNRAVALAEWKGAEFALAYLEQLVPPTWLIGSYLWSAVLSDLNRRMGRKKEAERYRLAALDLSPNNAIKVLLRRRLE